MLLSRFAARMKRVPKQSRAWEQGERKLANEAFNAGKEKSLGWIVSQSD
jgi:hypothetical protein